MKKKRILNSKSLNMFMAALLSLVAMNCFAAPTIENQTDVPAKVTLNFLTGSCTGRIADGTDIVIAPGEERDFKLDECALTKISAQIDAEQDDKWATAATAYNQQTPWAGGDFKIVKDEKYKESGGFGIERIE